MENYTIAGKSMEELLALLTLDEKAAFLSGKDVWHLEEVQRLGIPCIMVSDGPHGLRKQNENANNLGLGGSVPAVCFPLACLTACSWDPELLREMGEAIGEEALHERISVVLGPGVNIKRTPLCGRNFEYFSEDPYLAGELAVSFINGVQSRGVGTSLKHFAANSQESRRLSVNAVVDMRALREIYLPAFENAVKRARPWTVMNCYNKVNGAHGSENNWLQNELLRDEWGFDGLVVSDWGAVNDRVKGVKAGNDLEMPSSHGYNTKKIIAAVQSGALSMQDVDTAVLNVLKLIAKSLPALEQQHSYDATQHHALARKIARESMVLLKNEDDILPLAMQGELLVVGEMAEKPRYQGAGSSLINPTQVDSFCDILRENGVPFRYAQGYEKGAKAKQDPKALFTKAVDAAKQADTVLLFIGLTEQYESEGFDRKDMNLPALHNELVQALCNVNSRVIVVLSAGAPVSLPWFSRVQAVLHGYLAGQAGAGAMFDILSGAQNPCGKLAESYPFSANDTPCANHFPGNPLSVEYRESIFVGYRYYDKMQTALQFPFGFGLSYTQFSYSDLRLSAKKLREGEELTVSLLVTNTGTVAGKEIVQLYVGFDDAAVCRAPKELKAFCKVELQPGESKTVELRLGSRAFAYYNTLLADWHVQSGSYTIMVGASAADIRLCEEVQLTCALPDAPVPDYRETAPDYLSGDPAQISAAQFEAVLGYPLPPAFKNVNDPITLNDCFETASHTKWGARINKLIDSIASKLPEGEMIATTAKQARFNMLITMTGGLFTEEMASGLLRVLNGSKPGKGFAMILRGLPSMLLALKKMFL